MSTSKHSKYIVTALKENIKEAAWTPEMRSAAKGIGGRMLWLDSEVVPGAFYVETDWILPRKTGEPFKPGATPHSHDYDEVLCMFGTNMDDPYDLCGEVEFWLEDEKFILTKSCIIFIHGGMQHCPLNFLKVDRPIFMFTAGPGKMYV
jgi:hypothetical protein